MGKAAKQVQKDFEGMVSNAQAGLKALAASWAILNELKSGIRIATSMEEAIGNLKMAAYHRQGRWAVDRRIVQGARSGRFTTKDHAVFI